MNTLSALTPFPVRGVMELEEGTPLTASAGAPPTAVAPRRRYAAVAITSAVLLAGVGNLSHCTIEFDLVPNMAVHVVLEPVVLH